MPSLEAEYHLENEDEDKETDEDNDDGMAEDEVDKTNGALHKKWSFRLQISSVKVSYGFGYIYWRNLNGKLHFLWNGEYKIDESGDTKHWTFFIEHWTHCVLFKSTISTIIIDKNNVLCISFPISVIKALGLAHHKSFRT